MHTARSELIHSNIRQHQVLDHNILFGSRTVRLVAPIHFANYTMLYAPLPSWFYI